MVLGALTAFVLKHYPVGLKWGTKIRSMTFWCELHLLAPIMPTMAAGQMPLHGRGLARSALTATCSTPSLACHSLMV